MTDARTRGAGGGGVVRGTLLGAGVLLVFALLVLINYLGWKYHVRADWTETKIYSLSETTENVLRGLEEDVRVTVFITPGSRLYGPVRELLSRYEAGSPRLTVRWLDPERNPVEAQRLIEQYEVSAASVVFEAADERRVVPADDLAEIDFSAAQFGQEPEITAFQGEERFTSALVDLTQGEKPRVLFTTGHGELSLDDASASGLRAARDLLGPENVDIEEWASLGADRVPEGTDLVVVAGPQAAFTEDELAVLGGYLAGGGRLLVMVDPVLGPGEAGFVDLGLQGWLADYGVHVGDDVVLDPSTTPLGSSAETFYATRYTRHAITRSLADGGIPVLVRYARSVQGGSGPDGVTVTELLETGPDGWALTSLERDSFGEPAEDDLRGPVSLAVAVEAVTPAASETAEGDVEGVEEEVGEGTPGELMPEERAAGDPIDSPGSLRAGEEAPQDEEGSGMRLVVVGDSDFATSAFLQVGPGNQTFVNNLFNWLVERETLMGIPPKRPEQVRLSMTPSQLRWSVALVAVGLPLLALVLGVGVWLRRRRVR